MTGLLVYGCLGAFFAVITLALLYVSRPNRKSEDEEDEDQERMRRSLGLRPEEGEPDRYWGSD